MDNNCNSAYDLFMQLPDSGYIIQQVLLTTFVINKDISSLNGVFTVVS